MSQVEGFPTVFQRTDIMNARTRKRLATKKSRAERSTKIQAQREAEKASLKQAASRGEKAVPTPRQVRKGKETLPLDGSEGDEEDSSDLESHHADNEEPDDDIDMDFDGEDLEDLDGSDVDDEEKDESDEEMLDEADDPETRRLHARMQAAMEAAEKRALRDGADDDDEDTAARGSSSRRKGTKAEKQSRALTAQAKSTDTSSEHDLGPMALPLNVLSKAAAKEKEKKKILERKAELARIEEEKSNKRKGRRAQKEVKRRKVK